jgi:hypothetical protein
MTSERRHSITDAMIGGAITLIASLVLMVATGVWAAKENASDHRSDVQVLAAQIQRVLDVVCVDKPAVGPCRP